MKSMKLAALAASIAFCSTGAYAGEYDAKVTITNNSSWVLTELYISDVDETEWGPDQLQEQVIGSGETFTLNGVPCDAYDVKVVDEDGDSCVIEAVALCAEEDAWTVEDDVLLGCQEATDDSQDSE